MKDNKDIFSILTENHKRQEAILKLLNEMDDYPHIILGKKPAEIGDFYEQNKKKTSGSIISISVPTDLGIREMLVSMLKDEYDRLVTEFNSYTIKK